jgi:hypothetical protein
MSSIKDDKNKKPKGPLVITTQSPKKQNLDRRTFYSQQSITHIIFGDRNVVQIVWALKIQNAVKQKRR